MKKIYALLVMKMLVLNFHYCFGQTPNFSLTSISAPSPVTQYDCYSVTVTMHNNGPAGIYDFECDLNSSSGATWYRHIEKRCSNSVGINGNITLTFSTSSSSGTANHSSITQSPGSYSIQVVALYSNCFSCGNTGCPSQNVGAKTPITVQATSSSGYCMSNTAVTTCSGTFYDSGGSDKYGNNQNYTKTFTPSTSGSKVRMTFSSFAVENNYDNLSIYDGPNTSSTLIGTYTGGNSPGTVTATNTSGQLTFKFTSDGSNNCSTGNWHGWEASISCVSGCNSVSIGTQPQSQTKSVNSSATFSVSANGASPFNYQWYKNSSPISGANGSSYTTASLTMGDNGNTYYCIVTNCSGSYSATSNTATLTVTSGSGSPPVADFSSNTTSISSGQSVSYTDLSSNAPTAWDWTFPGGTPNSSSAQNPTISYNAPGTYSVSLKSYNNNGWSNTQYKGGYITVTSASGASISLSGNLSFGNVQVGNTSQRSFTISNAGNVTLNVSSIIFPSGFTGNWSGGTIAVGNIRNVLVTFSPTSATTYGGTITVNSNATSGTNTTSCSGTGTGSSSTPSGITINNVIPNNSAFAPKQLWSGTTTQTAETIKICADASKATEIVFTNNTGISSSNIRFGIAGDPNANDSDIFGYFILADYKYSGNKITVKFSHPKYLSSDYKLFRSADITVVDYTNSTIPIYTIAIEIYRAPVLMVHGLWGDIDSFREMEEVLDASGLYPTELTFRVDYFETNSSSFGVNLSIVPSGINDLILIARNRKYSMGKVDIVAHSMGGVLARTYIQWSLFQKRNDVHKLITLNTPHFGSQAANMLMEKSSCESKRARDLINVSLFDFHFNKSVDDGAVKDLAINSDAMLDLNVTNFNKGKVPCHSIVSKSDFPPSGNHDLVPVFHAISMCRHEDVPVCLDYMFNEENNDLIVSEPSQTGGLVGGTTSYFNDQQHLESPANISIINEVIMGLNTSSSDHNYFSQTGYRFVNQTSHYKKIQVEDTSHYASIIPGSLIIEFPIYGQSFNPGDTIHIKFNSTNGIDRTLLAAFSSTNKSFLIDTLLSEGILYYVVPNDAFSMASIAVLGYDTVIGDFIGYDTVFVKINVVATLDSITYYPDTVYTSQNRTVSMGLKGHFHNGTSFNLKHLSDLQVQVADTSIAQFTVSDLIKGKQVGTTSAVVSYLGKFTTVPIIVYPEDTSITNIATHNKLNSTPLHSIKVYPNPSNGVFNIQLYTIERMTFYLSVIDMVGNEIQADKWNVSSGENMKVLILSNAPSGLYTILLHSPSGIEYQRVFVRD